MKRFSIFARAKSVRGCQKANFGPYLYCEAPQGFCRLCLHSAMPWQLGTRQHRPHSRPSHHSQICALSFHRSRYSLHKSNCSDACELLQTDVTIVSGLSFTGVHRSCSSIGQSQISSYCLYKVLPMPLLCNTVTCVLRSDSQMLEESKSIL